MNDKAGEGALCVRLAGRRGALHLDAAFAAPAGAVTLLTGASGAGKTTLLRAAAGLERLTGEVRLGGETWQDARRFTPAHRRGVGFVFQHDALFPHLNVAENLRYGAERLGAPMRPGFEEIVTLLAVEPLLKRRPDTLSGGERRRVALGRALLAAPRLLLLDEPFAGLDPEARSELLSPLASLLRRTGTPVVLVSHDPADAAGLADRKLRLHDGAISCEVVVPFDFGTPKPVE